MKKIINRLKITPIDVIIYSIRKEDAAPLPDLDFEINEGVDSKMRKKYSIYDGDIFVHQTLVEDTANILRLIRKRGPLVSTSITSQEYRGKSIYPYVLNLAARNIFRDTRHTEVFGVVRSDNASSIRGLEKAGYKPRAKIVAKRFLIFFLNKKVAVF